MNKLLSPLLITVIISTALLGCSEQNSSEEEQQKTLNEKSIRHAIPNHVAQRDSWAKDMSSIMDELKIEKTPTNVCSIVAIVDQESNFIANPKVPGLGQKAVKEVSTRLEEKFTDKLGSRFGKPVAQYFNNVLKNQPNPHDNYLNQMKKVQTEKDLDLLYRQIFDYMTKHYHVSMLTTTAKFVGQEIGERMNPITTLGSMQVQVRYANDHLREHMNIYQLRDYLYTQYGGLYYGTHRLMMYEAQYNKAIYRFADYNSGMYSSRNASFQKILNQLTKGKLALDGDLLLYDGDDSVSSKISDTEVVLNKLFSEKKVNITPRQVRNDLEKEKELEFENTNTYSTLQKLYKDQTGKIAPYAIMPQVIISGPKLSKEYNTNWYATRVNGRYEACMNRVKH